MAFTKVVGPGIHTQSQLRTHNIHSSGIITASSFVGPLTASSGSSGTFDSLTITGNVSIGGTLQYEDVTNVESVGIITAKSGIRIGVGGTIGPSTGAGIVTYFGDGSNLTGISAGLTTDAQGNTVGGANAGDSFSGTSALKNTLFGYDAGTAITSADENTAFGHSALKTASTSGSQTAVGFEALKLSTSSYNTAVGKNALISENGSDGYNTAVGGSAGYGVNSGHDNTMVGYTAGNNVEGGNYNLILGAWSRASAAGANKECTIGGESSGRTIRSFRIPGIGLTITAPSAAPYPASDSQLFLPGNAKFVGVVTATSFVGGLPITNGANNRVITASSSSAIQGESNFTYDGSTLAVTGDVTMTNTSSNPQLALISANNGISEIQFGDGADAVRGNIIYRSGSAGDALCFNGYNNTERLRIDSSGLVGIGTTNPGKSLHINSSTPAIRLTDSDTSGPLHCDIESASGDLYLDTGSVHRDVIITSVGKSNEIAKFEGDGNVLIGGNLKTNNIPGRNKLINGNFHVWQRSTSSSAAGYVAADRWYHNLSGASMTFSRQAHTDPIDGSRYYARIASTTSDDNCGFRQRIEDAASIPEGKMTVSFWARGHVNGNLAVWATIKYGTGGSPSSDVDLAEQRTPYLQNDTTFRKYSLTFTIPSHSGKTWGTNNDSYFELSFGQGSGDSASAWTLDISNIQVEIGSVATAFEQRSYAEELHLCKRYYYKLHNADGNQIRMIGYGGGGTTAGFTLMHQPPMYKAPQGTLTVSSGNFSYNDGLAAYSGSGGWSFTGNRFSTDVNTATNAASGVLTGHCLSIYSGGSGTSIELNAEL